MKMARNCEMDDRYKIHNSANDDNEIANYLRQKHDA